MVEELLLEIDGKQLLFRSDVPEALAYIASEFGHMLSPQRGVEAARLGFVRTRDGFALESEVRSEWVSTRPDNLVGLLKDEVRAQFMRSRPDLLWLHAGAVARQGKVLLLSGPSGHGKSSIATHLVAGGWLYLSDDVAPMRLTDGLVVPFPQTPFRRIAGGQLLKQEDVYLLRRETVTIAPNAVARGRFPVGAIVFLSYAHRAAPVLQRLGKGPGAMEYLRNLTNLSDLGGSAVERAAALAATVPMFTLQQSSPGAAADAIEAEILNGIFSAQVTEPMA